MTDKETIKYLQQLYPNGGHCWLDEQRIEAISMAIKALQKEPISEKKCMFTKDNYTDEDRKVLCADCDERCEYNKKEQIMANAIDVTVHIDAGGYPYIPQIELYDYDRDIPLAKEGDKYKVILIKED